MMSNTITGLIYKIDNNELQIEYERDRLDRKIKNQSIETEELIYIAKLQNDIEVLERHLRECENK